MYSFFRIYFQPDSRLPGVPSGPFKLNTWAFAAFPTLLLYYVNHYYVLICTFIGA